VASPVFQAPLRNEIAEIHSVALMERRELGQSFVAYSPPGHLLHLVIVGEVRQRCNGREYHLRRGDMLWYHENESVEGFCSLAPWRFYSVVFHAPSLPPPDFSQRVSRVDVRQAGKMFSDLHAAWQDNSDGESRRALRCHAALSRILLCRHPPDLPSAGARPENWLGQLWWNIENQVRQNLGRAYTLNSLAAMARTSPATIHRASLSAVRISPVRRIKTLRLEMARGLLIYSQLSVTEIAEKTGYERVNELSRDIRKEFGASPREIRERAGTILKN